MKKYKSSDDKDIKNIKSDIGDILGDDYDAFDFDNLTADTNNRKPAGIAKNAISGSIKGFADGIVDQTRVALNREMPNTMTFFRDASAGINAVRELKQDFANEITPTITALRDVTNRLLPNVKKILPQRLYNKLDQLTKPKEGYTPQSEEEMVRESRDNLISSHLSEIFVTQTKALMEESKTTELRNLALSNIQQRESSELTASIRNHVAQLSAFAAGTMTAYMKKDLELKYRSLFVAQDTFQSLKLVANLLEAKLDNIVKNTGLPEIQKYKNFEKFKETTTNRLSESFSSHVESFIPKVKDKAKSMILDPIKGTLQNLLMGMDMAASISETARQNGEEFDPTKAMAKMGGGAITKKLAAMLVNTLGVEGLRKIRPYTTEGESIFKNAKTKGVLWLNKFRTENLNSGGLKGMLANMVPEFNKALQTKNEVRNDPTGQAVYDNIARLSIIEIIPGYLAKMLRELTILRTGNTDTEEMAFNAYNRKFETISDLKKNVSNVSFGRSENRSTGMVESIATLRQAHVENTGGEAKEYDSFDKDLRTLLGNLAYHKMSFSPREIQNFATGEVANNYITTAFDGIDDPKMLAKMIITSLTKPDGKLDVDTYRSIQESLQYLMNEDAIYRSKLISQIEDFGVMRYFAGDEIDEEGYVKQKSIVEYQSQIGNYEERLKDAEASAKSRREMYADNQRMQDEQFGTISSFADKTLDWAQDKINKTIKRGRSIIDFRDNEAAPEYVKRKLDGFIKALIANHPNEAKMLQKYYKKVTSLIKEYGDNPGKLISEANKLRHEIQERVQNLSKEDLDHAMDFVSEKAINAYDSAKKIVSEKAKEIIDPLMERVAPMQKALMSKADDLGVWMSTNFPESSAKVSKFKKRLIEIAETYKDTPKKAMDESEKLFTKLADEFTALASNPEEYIKKKKAEVEKLTEASSAKLKEFKEKFVDPKVQEGWQKINEGGALVKEIIPSYQPASATNLGDTNDLAFSIARAIRNAIPISEQDRVKVVLPENTFASKDMPDDMVPLFQQYFDYKRAVDSATALQLTEILAAVTKGGLKESILRMGKRAWEKTNRVTKHVWDGYTNIYRGALDLAGTTVKGVANVAAAAAPGAMSVMRGVVEAGGTLGRGTLDMMKGFYKGGWGFGKSVAQETGKGFRSIVNLFKKPIKTYVDIYRKGNIKEGSHLVTARQQERGEVHYASGKVPKSSSEINEPVYNNEQQVLITQDDIKAGLVDVEGNELTTASNQLGKKLLGGLSNLGKMFTSAGGMYSEMMKLIFKGGQHAMGMGSDIWNRFMGRRLNDEQLKPVLDKMDVMIRFLTSIDKNTSTKSGFGDTDSDGDRDNSYRDIMSQKKKVAGGLGIGAALGMKPGGGPGGRSADDGDSDEDHPDGYFATRAKLAGGGMFASGLAGLTGTVMGTKAWQWGKNLKPVKYLRSRKIVRSAANIASKTEKFGWDTVSRLTGIDNFSKIPENRLNAIMRRMVKNGQVSEEAATRLMKSKGFTFNSKNLVTQATDVVKGSKKGKQISNIVSKAKNSKVLAASKDVVKSGAIKTADKLDDFIKAIQSAPVTKQGLIKAQKVIDAIGDTKIMAYLQKLGPRFMAFFKTVKSGKAGGGPVTNVLARMFGMSKSALKGFGKVLGPLMIIIDAVLGIWDGIAASDEEVEDFASMKDKDGKQLGYGEFAKNTLLGNEDFAADLGIENEYAKIPVNATLNMLDSVRRGYKLGVYTHRTAASTATSVGGAIGSTVKVNQNANAFEEERAKQYAQWGVPKSMIEAYLAADLRQKKKYHDFFKQKYRDQVKEKGPQMSNLSMSGKSATIDVANSPISRSTIPKKAVEEEDKTLKVNEKQLSTMERIALGIEKLNKQTDDVVKHTGDLKESSAKNADKPVKVEVAYPEAKPEDKSKTSIFAKPQLPRVVSPVIDIKKT